MSTKRLQPTDNWRFIGAERLVDDQWVASDNFVKEMVWEFVPQFFSTNKTIGSILESTSDAMPIEMVYAYDLKKKLLKIDLSGDDGIDLHSDDDVDIYDVTYLDESADEGSTILLNIRTLKGHPSPYFRYILQKMR